MNLLFKGKPVDTRTERYYSQYERDRVVPMKKRFGWVLTKEEKYCGVFTITYIIPVPTVH